MVTLFKRNDGKLVDGFGNVRLEAGASRKLAHAFGFFISRLTAEQAGVK